MITGMTSEGMEHLASQWLPVLVDASIKGFAILALAGAAALVMRKASAAARQMLWFMALGVLLVVPLLSMALPSWRVLPSWAKVDIQAAQAAPGPAPEPLVERTDIEAAPVRGPALPPPLQPAAPTETPGQANTGSDRHVAVAPVVDIATPAAPVTSAAPPAPAAQAPELTPAPTQPKPLLARLLPWAMAAYLAGVLACLAPLVLSWLSLACLRRKSQVVVDGSWSVLLDRAKQLLGLRRSILLLESPRRSMPMIWGILRPKLLVPAEAANWSPQRRWVVLLHELAHAKRWDCPVKLLSHLACAAYWFNPLAWLAFKRVQSEAETACDDLVLAAGSGSTALGAVKASDYARHLLEVASGLKAGLLVTHNSIAMARPSKLEGRLLAILDDKRNRRRLTIGAILLAAAIVAGLAVPLSIMRAAGENEKQLGTEPAPLAGSGPGTQTVPKAQTIRKWAQRDTGQIGITSCGGDRAALVVSTKAANGKEGREVEIVNVKDGASVRLSDLVAKEYDGNVYISTDDSSLLLVREYQKPPLRAAVELTAEVTLIDLDSRKVKKVLEIPADFVSPVWLGNSFALIVTPRGHMDASQVRLFDRDGNERNVPQAYRYAYPLRCTADGKQWAVALDEDHPGKVRFDQGVPMRVTGPDFKLVAKLGPMKAPPLLSTTGKLAVRLTDTPGRDIKYDSELIEVQTGKVLRTVRRAFVIMLSDAGEAVLLTPGAAKGALDIVYEDSKGSRVTLAENVTTANVCKANVLFTAAEGGNLVLKAVPVPQGDVAQGLSDPATSPATHEAEKAAATLGLALPVNISSPIAYYKDGGTTGIVFRDAKGREYPFCLDGREGVEPPHHVFIGAQYPKRQSAKELPIGDPQEQALRVLLQAWADHQADRKRQVELVARPQGVGGLTKAEVDLLRVLHVLKALNARPATAPGTQPGNGAKPPSAAVEAAWNDLASAEPLKAYKAVWALAAAGQPAVDLVAARILLPKLDAKRVDELIRQLDDDKYEVRQKAKAALDSMGSSVEAVLKKAAQGSPSTEARTSIAGLLVNIEHSEAVPEARRQIRAVRALELIGSPASQALLDRMALSASWAAVPAQEALRRSSAKLVVPSLAGKTVMLAQWQAVVRPEMVEALLTEAKPVPIDSRELTAFVCDGQKLHTALRPALPDDQGRDMDMCIMGASLRWAQPQASTQSSIWSMGGFVHKQSKPVANCHFVIIPDFRYAVDSEGAQLALQSRMANGRYRHAPQAAWEFKDDVKLNARCLPGQAIVLAVDFEPGGSDHPHGLVILQTVPVPTDLIRYFESITTNSRWLRQGYDGMLRPAKEGLAWNAMAAPRRGAINPNWVRTLPGGSQVRLAGVWKSSIHPCHMWDGDGNPIPCDPMAVSGIGGDSLGVRLEARPNDKAPWKGICCTSAKTKLEVGIGDGPWKAAQTLTLKQAVKAGPITCTLTQANALVRKGLFQRGSVRVEMTYQQDPDADVAVGAVDKQGRLVVPKEQQGSPMPMLSRRQAGPNPLDCHFYGTLPLDISDVDHYVLLTRPRNWAAFENIATQPKAAPPATGPTTEATTAPASIDTGLLQTQLDAMAAESFDEGLASARKLAAAGDKAVALLSEQLAPVTTAPQDIARLVAQLDDDKYATRQAALRGLMLIGAPARAAIEKAAKDAASIEVRSSTKALLETLNDPMKAPGSRQAAWALRVLETIDTEAARALLSRLAGGAKDAWLTQESAGALARLDQAQRALDDPKPATLEFRVLPQAGEAFLKDSEYEKFCKALAQDGPKRSTALWAQPLFSWCEAACLLPNVPYIASYQGRPCALLCSQGAVVAPAVLPTDWHELNLIVDLARIAAVRDEQGLPALQVELGSWSSNRVGQLVRTARGRYASFVVDDKIRAVLRVDRMKNPILVTGLLSVRQAQAIVRRVRKGPLPVNDFADAIYGNKIDRVRQMLDEYPNLISARGARNNSKEDTPLHIALRDGKLLAIAQLLLDKGADVNAKGYEGRTPLHQAANAGDVEVIRFLLAHKANVMALDDKGMTPLHEAIMENPHVEAAVALIAGGADVQSTGKVGLTPLTMAVLTKCISYDRPEKMPAVEACITLLLDKGAKLDALSAAGLGKVDELKALLKQGSPMEVDCPGWKLRISALHLTAFCGQTAAATVLLDNGAKSFAIHEFGTPLHCAAMNGHGEVVALLLRRGAKVTDAEDGGALAIHRAAEAGHAAVVAQLLDAGCKIDATDGEGRTALYAAALRGQKSVVELLLKRGADAASANTRKSTPLHAVCNGVRSNLPQRLKPGQDFAACLSLLIKAGGKVQSADVDSMTPLLVLLGGTPFDPGRIPARQEMLRLLVASGADVNEPADEHHQEMTPLHYAVGSRDPKLVELLLQAGADPFVDARMYGDLRMPSEVSDASSDAKVRQEIADLLKDRVDRRRIEEEKKVLAAAKTFLAAVAEGRDDALKPVTWEGYHWLSQGTWVQRAANMRKQFGTATEKLQAVLATHVRPSWAEIRLAPPPGGRGSSTVLALMKFPDGQWRFMDWGTTTYPPGQRMGIHAEGSDPGGMQRAKILKDFAAKQPKAAERETAPSKSATDPAVLGRMAKCIEALKSEDARTVAPAVVELGQMGEAAQDALPALVELLNRKDVGFRTIAAWALGRIGPSAKEAAPALVKALHEKLPGDYFQVRKAAALALGRIGVGNKDVVSALIELLDARDDASINALTALGALGSQASEAVTSIRAKTANDPLTKSAGENAILRITGKGGSDPDLVNSVIGKRSKFICQYFGAKDKRVYGMKSRPFVVVYDRQGRQIVVAGPGREDLSGYEDKQCLEVEGLIAEQYISWPYTPGRPVPQAGFQIVHGIEIFSAKATTPAATRPASPAPLDAQTIKQRDQLLAAAGEKIQAGLKELAKAYPELASAKPYASIGPGKLYYHATNFNPPYYKEATSKPQPKPPADFYRVTVILMTPEQDRKSPIQMATAQGFRRLDLTTWLIVDAANPKLQAELKKLVADALTPLGKLDRRLGNAAASVPAPGAGTVADKQPAEVNEAEAAARVKAASEAAARGGFKMEIVLVELDKSGKPRSLTLSVFCGTGPGQAPGDMYWVTKQDAKSLLDVLAQSGFFKRAQSLDMAEPQYAKPAIVVRYHTGKGFYEEAIPWGAAAGELLGKMVPFLVRKGQDQFNNVLAKVTWGPTGPGELATMTELARKIVKGMPAGWTLAGCGRCDAPSRWSGTTQCEYLSFKRNDGNDGKAGLTIWLTPAAYLGRRYESAVEQPGGASLAYLDTGPRERLLFFECGPSDDKLWKAVAESFGKLGFEPAKAGDITPVAAKRVQTVTGAPAGKDRLPGSLSIIAQAMARKGFAWAAVCRATTDPKVLSGEAIQWVRAVEPLVGDARTDVDQPMNYHFSDSPKFNERPVLKGEQVIWIVRHEGMYLFGVMALPDTPANRKAVKAASTQPATEPSTQPAGRIPMQSDGTSVILQWGDRRLSVRPDLDKLTLFGLKVQDVFDVLEKAPLADGPGALDRLSIKTAAGKLIPLKNVVSIQIVPVPATKPTATFSPATSAANG